MTKLNPYLTFPGTATEAIELYKKVFKKDPVFLQRFKDMPADAADQSDMQVSGAAGERILHAMFDVGGDKLMLSDAPEGQDDTVVSGSQTHVSIHPENRNEADRIFGILSEGGKTTMPMADMFWGDYFGMCTDKFGVNWMVNYQEKK